MNEIENRRRFDYARMMLMGEEWLQWINIPDEGIGAVKEEGQEQQVRELTVAVKGLKLGFKEEEEEEENYWFQQMVAGVEEAEEAHMFLNPAAYVFLLNPVFDERVGVISDLNPNLDFNRVVVEEEDMCMRPQWEKRTYLQQPFHHSRILQISCPSPCYYGSVFCRQFAGNTHPSLIPSPWANFLVVEAAALGKRT